MHDEAELLKVDLAVSVGIAVREQLRESLLRGRLAQPRHHRRQLAAVHRPRLVLVVQREALATTPKEILITKETESVTLFLFVVFHFSFTNFFFFF